MPIRNKKPFWVVFLIGGLLFPFSVANAWSLFGLTIGGQEATIQPSAPVIKNSQNMALAEAPLAHDLNQEKNDDNTEVVDDTALSAGLASSPAGDGSDNMPSSDQISTYVVHEGDTLSQVAKMFNVSINTILWANDIPKGGSLKTGQQLVILPVSGVKYTVKSGDTLAKIAKKYNADSDEILAYNDVDEKLNPGDIIIIPNGIETPAPSQNSVQKAITRVVQAFNPTNGYFVRPISGARTQGLHGHNGIDFRASVGTSIVAAAGGTVEVARSGGYNGGYGSYVVIKHPNGTQTLYGHMSQVLVYSGMTVKQGQTIGLSGNTGKSTGPHLHFEVRGGVNPF